MLIPVLIQSDGYSTIYLASKAAKQFNCVENTGLVFKSKKVLSTFFNESKNLSKTYYEKLSSEINSTEAKKVLDVSQISLDTLIYIAKNELDKMLKLPKDRIFYIITGRSGSGKSTLVRKLNLDKQFYIPDTDNIKQQLPFYIEKGASYVHKASYIINRTNLSEALKNGTNCVIQTTTTFDNIDGMIEEAKKNGYYIKLIHINVDENTAIDRCIRRAKARGRNINPEYIRERKYIDDIVSNYKKSPKGLNEIIVFDNNGKQFELLEHFIIDNI